MKTEGTEGRKEGMEGEEDMEGRCLMNSSLQVDVWRCISNLKVNERKREREREVERRRETEFLCQPQFRAASAFSYHRIN